jgi:hypothetical protein
VLIPFPVRVLPHLIDFGYFVEPTTGAPARGRPRGRLRRTDGLPEGCCAVALPGRIAGHVAALPEAIHGAGGPQDAILVQPVLRALPDAGRMTIEHVAILRVCLDEVIADPERPGDSVRSRGLVFDIATFSQTAPDLTASLAALSEPVPVSIRSPAQEWLGIPRAPLTLAARMPRQVRDVGPAARKMVGALLAGVAVRLGQGDCGEPGEFLDALADVYSLLPPGLRCAVSASLGLTREDPGTQLSFSLESPTSAMRWDPLEALPQDMTLPDAAARLFTTPARLDMPATACHVEDGLLVSTRLDGRLAIALMQHIAAHALVKTPDCGQPLSDMIVRIADAWPCDPVMLQQARLALGAAGPAAAAQLAKDLPPGDAASALGLLAGTPARKPALPELRLALELSAGMGPASWLGRGAARAALELHALLRHTQLLTPDMLAVLASGGAISARTAAMAAEADETISRILRRSVALAEMMGADSGKIARQARMHLAPQDGRADCDWRVHGPAAADPLDLLTGLLSGGLKHSPGAVIAVPHLARTLASQRRLKELAQIAELTRRQLEHAQDGQARQQLMSIVADLCSAALGATTEHGAAPGTGSIIPFPRSAPRPDGQALRA